MGMFEILSVSGVPRSFISLGRRCAKSFESAVILPKPLVTSNPVASDVATEYILAHSEWEVIYPSGVLTGTMWPWDTLGEDFGGKFPTEP